MSGKVHSGIGVSVSVALFIFIVAIGYKSFSFSLLLSLASGAFAGSWLTDIDSKKSKASQKFTKVIVILCWIFFLTNLVTLLTPSISNHTGLSQDLIKGGQASFNSYSIYFLNKVTLFVDNKFFLMLFCILVTLGKVSPHRQFTHKWLGTSLFIVLSYLTFTKVFAIGMILGYLLHIIADKFTPAGLNFLDTKLPGKTADGNFKFHF